MAQEFISVRGKVVIERDILFIRTFTLPSFPETVLFEILVGIIALVLFISSFFIQDDGTRFLRIIISIVILTPRILPLYDILFKRSLATRIPLRRIKSYELKENANGLESTLILYLRSGRYKPILFRSLEKQYEPLASLISQHIAQPQFA